MEEFMGYYYLFWVCIFGLCLGSFYNVVILRSLSDESIIFPPSKCPKCQNKLKAWHNIPILSYILLRGKCAYCKEKISIQYPIIEFITMCLFAFTYIKFGLTWQALLGIILSSCLLIMTVTDIKEQLVDCNIAIGLSIIGLVYNWLVNGTPVDSILGLLAGALIMELLARFGYLIAKKRAFGEADTYVAGALGACFGVNGLLTVLAYSLIASMFFILPMFLYKQYKLNNKFTCITFILFTLSLLVFKFYFQNFIMLSLVAIIGLTLCYSILKGIKEETTSTYLPLVPAFTLGALYYFFF
ncbi:MAG: prepilin peptidase [Cyanobacteria bacterium SIG28]|nr:prepilin peptidase [Cyanobacteria bacterium SIG28]